MGRRRGGGLFDMIFDLCLIGPLWLGPIIAAVIFAAMRWVSPWWFAADPNDLMAKTFSQVMGGAAVKAAPWTAGVILLVWAMARFKVRADRPPVVQPVAKTPDSTKPTNAKCAGTPTCPTCGAVMKQRTARRGQNAGSQFWGCSRYPECNGTRPLASAQT